MNGTTTPHEVFMSWDGVDIMLKPAPEGTGVIAGSKVRAVLELAGIKDVVTKCWGKNPLNQVRATVKALKTLRSKEKSLAERGAQE